ncbi:MAG TPA: histidine--tRNA ligase [Solirubrobacterales bacterium]|nr:histidine--tRNA ligase [Solirubrobacterales bacterium]
MSEGPQAPRGTFDVLPRQAVARARVRAATAAVLQRAGYGEIETPIYEDTDLFARGVGETTDIVEKEMFTFEDQSGRSLTLRPEGTASVCRAYVEHGMHKLAQPVRLWYWGPYFRYEAPQAGRYRQFNQVGLEAIGSDSPLVDAEAIILLHELIAGLGVPGIELKLGSLASPQTRSAYREELAAYLQENEADLAPEVRSRIDANPLRAFDSKDDGTRRVMAAAPKLLDRLEGEDAEHFAEVRTLLDAAGVEYELDPSLVRGLDYYTRTVFAFTAANLGAQSEVGGGGRYDGLVEQLGGPAAAGVGWAAGIERILLALGDEGEEPRRDVFVAAAGDGQRHRALALAGELRRAGLSAEVDLAGRSLKGQMKQADRIGARHAVILEEDGGAQLKEMESGEQRDIDPAAVLADLTD